MAATILLWWWKLVISFAALANAGVAIYLLDQENWSALYFAGLAAVSARIAWNTWREP